MGVWALEANPVSARVYAGGDFTSVPGVTHRIDGPGLCVFNGVNVPRLVPLGRDCTSDRQLEPAVPLHRNERLQARIRGSTRREELGMLLDSIQQT